MALKDLLQLCTYTLQSPMIKVSSKMSLTIQISSNPWVHNSILATNRIS